MRTKDISSIITKGSPRQRLNLLYSHFALLQFDKEGFLTETEISKLKESFKTSQEIDLYNKYIAIDNIVRYSLLYLNQIMLGVKEQIAHINGYCLFWESQIRNTELLNKLLDKVKGKKLKDKLIKEILDEGSETFFNYISDKEGYIEMEINETINEIINIHKKNTEKMLVTAKTFIKALKDFIEENKFKIEEYEYQIKIIEEYLQQDKALWPKYSRKMMEDVLGEKGKDPEFSKFFIYPDYDSIEIDEAQYKDFRENYLYEK